MFSMEQRVAASGITAVWVVSGGAPEGWPDGSVTYSVTLSSRTTQERMTVPFTMGPALAREPELAEVLDCLASDAAGYLDSLDFEDWARSYDYDPDSRSAEAIYRTIGEQARALRALLGADFEAFLWATEKL